jgi:hypothetical protein
MVLMLAAVSMAALAEKSYTDYPQLRHFFPLGMYVAAERIGEWGAPDSPTHYGRPMLEPYRLDLEDMARHRINMIAVENTSGIPVPVLKQMLGEGERAGVLMWASENGLPDVAEAESYARRRISLLKDEKGLLVWSPWDEPYPENMEKWLKWKQAFEAADPNHPVIAVTCGGPKGFELHDVVQGYDYYPVYVENPNPWDVAPMVRRYVEAAPKPVWFVVQAFQGEGRRMPTVAESRLMTYAALGEGAKGILYFIYDHLVTHYNYPVTPQWDDIGEFGRFLRAVGPELLETRVDRESKLVRMTASPEKVQGSELPSAVCSVLKSPEGHSFVIVYNNDVLNKVSVNLTLAEDAGPVRLYDLNILVDRNLTPGAASDMSLILNPGDGRILLAADRNGYSRTAGRIRLNLYAAEKQVLAIDRDPAAKCGLDLSDVDKLAERADKAVALNDPYKAVTLVLDARAALDKATQSDAEFSSARQALDEVRSRLREFDRSLSEFRSANPDRWEDKMKWPLDGAISRCLDLEYRFRQGDKSVAPETRKLLDGISAAVTELKN